MSRGRYFTIPLAVEAYEGVLTVRLLRRLVAERRIAFTYAGRRVVIAEADLERYLEDRRVEPVSIRSGIAGKNGAGVRTPATVNSIASASAKSRSRRRAL